MTKIENIDTLEVFEKFCEKRGWKVDLARGEGLNDEIFFLVKVIVIETKQDFDLFIKRQVNSRTIRLDTSKFDLPKGITLPKTIEG